MQATSLVRVTIATPYRRIDMALPEYASVAEVLPGLLVRTGVGPADDGSAHGGWLLRRFDGTALDLDRTLASHQVRDGEILHLTERGVDWPELEYDDLVDAIATGSRRIGAAWGPRHTRWAGLTAGVVALLLGLVAVIRTGPSWTVPALWALALSASLLIAGLVLARAFGDAGVGVVLAAMALPYAFTGGGLLLASDKPISGLSGGQLVAAGAALMFVALAGQIAVTAAPAMFAAAAMAGLCAIVGGWLATTGRYDAPGAAAVIGGGVLLLSTGYAPLALRIGQVPMPVLPRSTADLVRDEPQPPLLRVHAAVARADGVLTGMIAGSSAVVMCCQVLLIRNGSTAALLLDAVLAAGFLIRARLHPVLRQRLPLLLAGAFGIAGLILGPFTADRPTPLTSTGPLLILAAALIAAGVVHSTRAPNSYLSRLAEYSEVLIMVAVVPLVCWVLGLFAYVRGLGG